MRNEAKTPSSNSNDPPVLELIRERAAEAAFLKFILKNSMEVDKNSFYWGKCGSLVRACLDKSEIPHRLIRKKYWIE